MDSRKKPMQLSLSRNAPRNIPALPESRLRATWSSADYAVVGAGLQIVADELCETVNLCEDSCVLDVAMGQGAGAQAAARRWCDVTATDFAPDDADRKRQRTDAENLGVRFVEGEVTALPFADQTFDAVLSVFAAMFAADPDRAASEMVRVCRRGGTVALANWTAAGFIGQLFGVMARHCGQPAEGAPFLWGTEEYLWDLFGAYGRVETVRKRVAFRHRSPKDWLAKFRAGYEPVQRMLGKLEKPRQHAFDEELLSLAARSNRATDGSMVVDAEYLEVLVTRR
jgi:SAM-dependent methyltransferase